MTYYYGPRVREYIYRCMKCNAKVGTTKPAVCPHPKCNGRKFH